MQRRKNLIGIILTIILVLSLGGCATKNINVENTIMEQSKQITSMFEVDKHTHLNIERTEEGLEFYPDGYVDQTYVMLIPCNWYDKTEFEIPEMLNEEELPKTHQRFFEQAKKIALEYVECSKIIEEKDKKKCKKALNEVTIHYGNFVDKDYYENYPMITSGNHIYINVMYEEYLTIYPYLHELIHVISNTTNEGAEYEHVMYRSSKINEAITDLIAVELLKEYSINGYEISGYITYYELAYYMIDRFDMLNTYFYSDGYADIIDDIGLDSLDLYMLLTDNCETENIDFAFFYVINEWYK